MARSFSLALRGTQMAVSNTLCYPRANAEPRAGPSASLLPSMEVGSCSLLWAPPRKAWPCRRPFYSLFQLPMEEAVEAAIICRHRETMFVRPFFYNVWGRALACPREPTWTVMSVKLGAKTTRRG